MTATAIEATKILKAYGDHFVLNDVDLAVKEGEVARHHRTERCRQVGTVKFIGGLIARVRRFWWKALSQFTFRRRSG